MSRTASGFAESLLRRARGEVTAIRPRIAPYFAGTGSGDADPPLIEETVERASEPPAATPPRASEPRPAPPPSRSPGPPFEPPAATPAVQNHSPLMPPRTEVPPAPAPPEIHSDAPEPAGAPRAVREPPATAAPPPRPTPAARTEEPQAAAAKPRADGPAEAARPDLMRQLAAALARLDAGAEPAAPPLLPEVPVPEMPPPPEILYGEAKPAEGTGTSAEALQPLTIHIGEIVIAPDPVAAAAPGRDAPRPAWKPALSIDDYRARRSRPPG